MRDFPFGIQEIDQKVSFNYAIYSFDLESISNLAINPQIEKVQDHNLLSLYFPEDYKFL